MNTRSVDPISSTSAAPEPSVTTRPKRRSVFLEEVIKNKGRLKSDRNKPLPKPPKPPKSRNEKVFYLIGAILLVLGLGAIVWQNWGQDYVRSRSTDSNVKPVAKLYNEYITEKQFKDSVDDRKLLSQKLHGGEQDQYAEAQVYDDLLLERALEAEAKKRSITISDGDIDAEILKAKVSLAQLNQDADKNGVSRDVMRRGWRLAALKTKLATYLLDTRDVRQYFVRWDYAPPPYGTDIVKEAKPFDEFQNRARERLRQLVDAPLRAGKSQDEILDSVDINIDKYDAQVKPLNLIARSIDGMNRKADAQFQDGKNDWAAIEALNKDGQYSDIIRSDGGYYAIYYLKHRNSGQFISWNDFLNSVKKNTKKFTAASYTTHYAAVQTDNSSCRQDQISVLDKILTWAGIGQAKACGSGHLNRFNGTVTDSGGYSVNNLSIKIIPRNPASVEYCSGATGATYHTNASGYWDTNLENGAVRYSCFMQWAMVVSNSCGNSQWFPLINPGTNNGTVTNNVTFNGGNCGTSPSIVAIDNIDCTTDTITGWAVSPANPGGPGVIGNPHNSYASFFFREQNNPLFAVGNGSFQEHYWFGGYASFEGAFGPWPTMSNFENYNFEYGTASSNPVFIANVAGSWPLESTYTTYPHRFQVQGLLGYHMARIPERNFNDGKVYSIIPTALDPNSRIFSSAFGAFAEVNFQCESKYDVTGNLSTAGAPVVAGNEPNLAGASVGSSYGIYTSANAAPNFTWDLYNFRRDSDYYFSAASPYANWENYAWTACMNGDVNCHGAQTKSNDTALINHASIPGGSNPDLRFYYRPLPAAPKVKLTLDDGTNPCSLAASDYRNKLCSTSINASMAGSVGGYSNANISALNTVLNDPNNSTRTYVFNSGPSALGAGNNQTSFSDLYPGNYSITIGGAVPSGFSLDSTWVCDGAGNNCSKLTSTLVTQANDDRVIEVRYKLRNATLFGAKSAPQNFPGTYPYYTPQTGLGGNTIIGTVTLDTSTTSSAHWSTPTWQSDISYGAHSIKVTAPDGWEVRGYGFCLTAAATTCTASISDATETTISPKEANKIILNTPGSTTMDISLTVDTGGNMQIAGNTVAATQNVGIVYYFKPTTVSVQARVVIDKNGPDPASNNDLSPCSNSIPVGDYKRNLCNTEVRAVRINSTAMADIPAPNLYDPVTGIGANPCASATYQNDYVPQRPGFGYKFLKSYYCSGSDVASTTTLDGATPYIKVGSTWDANSPAAGTGPSYGVSTNTSEDEFNVAIFRNLYPGKYRFEYRNAPTHTQPGYPTDQAYSVDASYCSPQVTKCSDSDPPSARMANCPGTNWSPSFRYPNTFRDPAECTNIWGTNDLQPRNAGPLCNLSASPLANYGYFPPGGNPNGCGQYKTPNSSVDAPVAVGDFLLTPYKQNNPDKWREATFIFTPKIKAYNPVLTCDTYDADVIYLPDPSRQVTSTIQVGADVTDPADPSKLREYRPVSGNHLTIDIPKWVGNVMVKDGKGLRFNHFVYYDDPALSPPPGGVNGATTPGYKYVRTLAHTGVHACKNDALCDQAGLQAQADQFGEMDANKSYTFTVKMTNTGKSYWQNQYNDTYDGVTHNNATTDHQLAILATNGMNSGYLGVAPLPNSTLLGSVATGGLTLQPVNSEADPNNAATKEKLFTFSVTTPSSGASKYSLEIGMQGSAWNGNPTFIGQVLERFPLGPPPTGKCVVNFEVRNNYHPWLRVQNGGVGALGNVQNQRELDRGTYKALNPTGTAPLTGAQGIVPGVADINSFAQFTVISAANANYFCSSNGYLYGRDTPASAAPNFYTPKSCGFDASEYNLDAEVKANLKTAHADLIYRMAQDSLDNRSGCKDDGSTGALGPEDSSNPSNYYRNMDDISDVNNFDKVPTNPAVISLVRVNKTDGTIMDRPCPTIRNWTSGTLPALQIGRGRGTLMYSSGGSSPLLITGNITNVISDAYMGASGANSKPIQIKQGAAAYDIAQLNRIPNLGIIVDGDVVISDTVTRIDAAIYATGQIYTCSSYPSATVGSKASLDRNGNPNPATGKFPMLKDEPQAALCNKQLKINGSLASGKSFALGRNYIDFTGIVNRFNTQNTGIFTAPSNPLLAGKFCSALSETDLTLPRCGQPRYNTMYPDFDNLNAADPYSTPAGKNFLTREGYPQSLYYGGPAEDVLYNGLMLVAPPPGFENVSDNALNRARFDSRSFPPLF